MKILEVQDVDGLENEKRKKIEEYLSLLEEELAKDNRMGEAKLEKNP